MDVKEPEWIAVDWGTSSVRAWGIAADESVLFSAASDRGMGRLAAGEYPDVLAALTAGHLESAGPQRDVMICGMAGARQGWAEAPYLDVPVTLDDLLSGAVAPVPAVGRLSPRILPGLCERRKGAEDVMRGEETQLLGLAALLPGFDGIVALPGTHCKWVRLSGRRVEGFSSAMTGEVFEILRLHSVLRHSLAGESDDAERARGTTEGLGDGMDAPEKLLSRLFRVRSVALLSRATPSWCAGYLSGLLVGTDIGAQRVSLTGQTAVIGAPGLSRLYGEGLKMIGIEAQAVDATAAVLAGLTAARRAAT